MFKMWTVQPNTTINSTWLKMLTWVSLRKRAKIVMKVVIIKTTCNIKCQICISNFMDPQLMSKWMSNNKWPLRIRCKQWARCRLSLTCNIKLWFKINTMRPNLKTTNNKPLMSNRLCANNISNNLESCSKMSNNFRLKWASSIWKIKATVWIDNTRIQGTNFHHHRCSIIPIS